MRENPHTMRVVARASLARASLLLGASTAVEESSSAVEVSPSASFFSISQKCEKGRRGDDVMFFGCGENRFRVIAVKGW